MVGKACVFFTKNSMQVRGKLPLTHCPFGSSWRTNFGANMTPYLLLNVPLHKPTFRLTFLCFKLTQYRPWLRLLNPS